MVGSDLGELSRHGSAWRLTFTRRLEHPPPRVWQAVSEPAGLAAWFPQRVVGELRAGARLSFVSPLSGEFAGEVLVFDPPKVLELTWGPDRLRIELRPDGNGTVLSLTDTFTEEGKAARDAAGWHECLERLAARLDGAPPRDWGTCWQEVHPRYVAHFGPTAAAIGPPAPPPVAR